MRHRSDYRGAIEIIVVFVIVFVFVILKVKGYLYVKSCTQDFPILNSTLSHLDSTFWLDSLELLYSA